MKPAGILITSLLLLAAFTFTSCEEKNSNAGAYDDFKAFVMERNAGHYRFNKPEWNALESKYHNLVMVAEIVVRNNESGNIIEFGTLQKQWEQFRQNYFSAWDAKEKSSAIEALCLELLPPGVNPDLSNADPSNIKDIYLHFVNVIEAHQYELSAEHMEYINSLWTVIRSKKAEFESRLSVNDNREFGKYESRFNFITGQIHPSEKLLAKY